MTDGLPLENGKMYYSLLKVTNALNYTYILRSNGVTVEKNPLLPGKVFDGDVSGYDLNFLPSKTVVYANWDGFGLPADAMVQVDVLSGMWNMIYIQVEKFAKVRGKNDLNILNHY